MKAVNLTPADQRGASRPSPASYGLLGVLALMVVFAGVYAMTGKSIRDTQAEILTVKAQADAAEAKTAALKPYTTFTTMRKDRTDTVTKLAASRLDWAHVLHEVARTVPADTSLSELHGTTGASGSAAAAPAAGATATAGPTVDISGCTGGQRATARLMVELRRIDGIDDVTLSSSKVGDDGASSGSAAGGGGCTGKRTQFSMTLKLRSAATTAATTPAITTGSTP
jgi:Tfp pilus assembly protein PilN